MSRNANDMSESTKSRQTLFALAIAKGRTIKDASKFAGIAEVTGYRWSHDRRVVEIATGYRVLLVRETIGRLANMGSKASQRLEQLIESEDPIIALKASVFALSEVRRVADSIGNSLYTQALPAPPIAPSPPVDPNDPLQGLDASSLLFKEPFLFTEEDKYQAKLREHNRYLEHVEIEAETLSQEGDGNC